MLIGVYVNVIGLLRRNDFSGNIFLGIGKGVGLVDSSSNSFLIFSSLSFNSLFFFSSCKILFYNFNHLIFRAFSISCFFKWLDWFIIYTKIVSKISFQKTINKKYPETYILNKIMVNFGLFRHYS